MTETIMFPVFQLFQMASIPTWRKRVSTQASIKKTKKTMEIKDVYLKLNCKYKARNFTFY